MDLGVKDRSYPSYCLAGRALLPSKRCNPLFDPRDTSGRMTGNTSHPPVKNLSSGQPRCKMVTRCSSIKSDAQRSTPAGSYAPIYGWVTHRFHLNFEPTGSSYDLLHRHA
jgi:hypothetical protein